MKYFDEWIFFSLPCYAESWILGALNLEALCEEKQKERTIRKSDLLVDYITKPSTKRGRF